MTLVNTKKHKVCIYDTKKHINKYSNRTTMVEEDMLEFLLGWYSELYLSENTYPLTLQKFNNIPFPDYALNVSSQEELYGRIKQLGQLLNATKVCVGVADTEVTLTLV